MTALWLVAGSLVGLVNDLMRQWTVSRLGRAMPAGALALLWSGLLLRLVLVTALLVLGLEHGIGPGLLAFVGLWLARWATAIRHAARPGLEAECLPGSFAD
ncbi:MAG: hypothetical protein PVG25_06775 [Anaerolineae bacterium]